MKMKKIKLFLFFIAFCVFGTYNIWAITVTSIADGNWSSSATWDCACVPSSTDQVIIQNQVALDSDITINPGGSLTVNSGASLVGTTSVITYVPDTSTPSYFTNDGTVDIGRFLQTQGGCRLFEFVNNGDMTVNDTDAYPTTSSSDVAMFFRSGHIVNNGTITVPNGEIMTTNNSGGANCNTIPGAQSGTLFENNGTIVTQAFLQHNYSEAINTGLLVVQGSGGYMIDFAGYYFKNYGTIQTCGDIRIHAKGGVNSIGPYNGSALVVYDGSKIYVPGGGFNIDSNTYLVGEDSPSSACVYIEGNINNNGAISGELDIHNAGSPNGTIGANVNWTSGDCGWSSLGYSCDYVPAVGCPDPNCGSASISSN